ncbi:hypothetical protein DFH08DRAFT_822074 [Mycena albidolilacea]|uniref:Uncharacterized protein n=1 Tax=Mycena albidolilacea TaxID=1033008 RepID=A0AAD7ECR3_9AGAR|nr:hypothetical protein DFH08DRAFT_822074 [Mycena albidolilacea]
MPLRNAQSTKKLHPLQVLEAEYPGRPRMRIRFYQPGHVGVCRIQMVSPRHGDVFYLRALLLHRCARDWVDLRTIDGAVYNTYQEAARVMALFDNREQGIMAFDELVDTGAAPVQWRWIFCVLATEGSSALAIWDTHEQSLGAVIRDQLLRITSSPHPDVVRNRLLLILQSLLRGLGRSLAEIGLPEPVERQHEIDAEHLQWSGARYNLCAFKDGLTQEQVGCFPFYGHFC